MNQQDTDQRRCSRCDSMMQEGFATALGLIGVASQEPRVAFVVPGNKTSWNPVTAFRQGLDGDRQDEAYLLTGLRCPDCGAVEFHATEHTVWPL